MKRILSFLIKEDWEESIKKVKEFSKKNLEDLYSSSPTKNSINFFINPILNNETSYVCIGFLKDYPNVIVLFFYSNKEKSENILVVPFDKINENYFFKEIKGFLKKEIYSSKMMLVKGNYCHVYRDWKNGFATENTKESIPVLITDIHEQLKLL